MRLFISSLFLTIVSGFVMGVRFSLPGYMRALGWDIPSYIGPLFGYAGYLLTAIALYAGISIGRQNGVETSYHSYIGVLIAGSFVGFVTLLLPQFTPINEDIAMIANMGAVAGMSATLHYPAKLFSGICIGWFLRDRDVARPSIEKRLVRMLALYQGWFIIVTVIRILVYQGISIETISRPSMMYYLTMVSWGSTIVGLTYLYCLFKAGKDLDMRMVFENVLFTLFIFSVGGIAVRNALDILGGSHTIVTAATSLVGRTIGYGFSIFGAGFAITCYGYLRKKYRFPAYAKKTETG